MALFPWYRTKEETKTSYNRKHSTTQEKREINLQANWPLESRGWFPVPFARTAAIALGGSNGNFPIGPTTIMNNQFQSNTRDTRHYPVPLLGSSYSATNKNNQFITVSSTNLRLCTISCNYGDGIIYLFTAPNPNQIATYQSNPTWATWLWNTRCLSYISKIVNDSMMHSNPSNR